MGLWPTWRMPSGMWVEALQQAPPTQGQACGQTLLVHVVTLLVRCGSLLRGSVTLVPRIAGQHEKGECGMMLPP